MSEYFHIGQPSQSAIRRQSLGECDERGSAPSSQPDMAKSTGPGYAVNTSFGLGVIQMNLGIVSVLVQVRCKIDFTDCM